MKRKNTDARTWISDEIASQERVLEMRVSNAQRELDRVKAWHRAELTALRKFRKAKVTHAARIVPASVVTRPLRGSAE